MTSASIDAARRAAACRPHGREHDPEPEERGVRDGLVERVPAAIGTIDHAIVAPVQTTSADHVASEQRAPERPTRGSGSRRTRTTTRQPRAARRRSAADRKDAAEAGSVARERGALRAAAPTRPAQHESAGAGAARGRLRRPSPWRGHATSGPRRFPIAEEGTPRLASNKSFTLPTPPDHLVPGDSRRHWASGRARDTALEAHIPPLRASLGAARPRARGRFVALSARGHAPPPRRRAGRRCSPTGSTTAASTASTRCTATRRRSTRSRPTSATTRTRRRSSRARSRARCAASSRPVGATRPRATTTGSRQAPAVGGSGGSNGGSDGGERHGSGTAPQATPDVDTSGPSSVPIPLLVLGGMSLALLAAGGLGYLSRRRQAAARARRPTTTTTLG